MNWKRRLCVVLMLAAFLLVPLSVVSIWADDCPPGAQVYFGGPVTNSEAFRGSKANPANDKGEAEDICQGCPNGAYLYEYSDGEYIYVDVCIPEEDERTGAPLAQPIVMALLGLLAAGLLTWGICTRLRLKRLNGG
jgi:hypothetical protein